MKKEPKKANPEGAMPRHKAMAMGESIETGKGREKVPAKNDGKKR